MGSGGKKPIQRTLAMDILDIETIENLAQCGAGVFSDLFGEPALPCKNPRCFRIPPDGREYCDGACRAEASRIRKAEDEASEAQKRINAEHEAWREYDRDNPQVWEIIRTDLYGKLEHFLGKVSIGAVIEYKVRMIFGYHIPNAYKKFYREKFITEHPEYKELFK